MARDRVISTVDVEARHGHKSQARRFDGYKTHVAIDPDSEIITEVVATPANTPDREVVDDLIGDLADADGPDLGEATDEASDPGEADDTGEPAAGDRHAGESGEGPESEPTVVGDSAYADAATRSRLQPPG